MQQFTCNLHMWSENVLRNFIAWLKADILYTIIASCDSQNQSVFIFSVYILMRLKCKIYVVQKPTEVNKHPNCCVWAFLRLFQMMQKINFYLFFKSIFFFLQVWPEVTDPEKFVYEDVAIATYLLVGNCFT